MEEEKNAHRKEQKQQQTNEQKKLYSFKFGIEIFL